MPEIEITEDQRERLRAVQEALEADVVGKYGHVRASDAVEYLLDRYGDEGAGAAGATGTGDGETATDAGSNGDGETDATGDDGDGPADADDAVTGEDDAELDAMMNLLDEHDDRWGESDASDARYEVELPDGTVEHARTKDDVRGLLFRHYR